MHLHSFESAGRCLLVHLELGSDVPEQSFPSGNPVQLQHPSWCNFESHSQFISLPFLSLVSICLGHTVTPLRKQSVWECLRVLSTILLLPRLADIPKERTLTRVASPLLSSEIPMFWSKLLLSKIGKKIVWIFRQSLGHTVSGPSDRKCSFCQQGPVSRFTLSMCPCNIQEYSRQT